MMKNKEFCGLGLILTFVLFFAEPFAHAEPAGEIATIQIKPSILFVGTVGDREKYEEDHWTSRDVSGGFEQVSVSKALSHQDSLEFEGRAIAGNNDYDSALTLSREGVGSLVIAFKEFRRFYDGTGGYFSGFPTSSTNPGELEKDLHLDIGKFRIDGRLAKENAPEYYFSYGRDARHGSKSLLRWNYVQLSSATQTSSNRKMIGPAFLETDEVVNKLKVGIKKTGKNSEASAEQSWVSTKSENKNIYGQTFQVNTGATSSVTTQFYNMDSDLYSTVLRYSRELNKKVSASVGVLYNHFIGGSEEYLSGNGKGNPASIDQNTLTIFPNLIFKPFNDMLVNLGSKAEAIDKHGDSLYWTTSSNPLVNTNTDILQKNFTQSLSLKYSGFKDLVLFSDSDFEKAFINQYERQDGDTSANTFSRKTNTVTNNSNFAVGFKWYPASKFSVTLQEKSKNGHTNNDHEFLTGDITTLGGTYRGFIDSMRFTSHAPMVKLNCKPFRWMASSLSYTYDSTVYAIRTRVSSMTVNAKYNAHIYSGDVTLTPYDYLYFTLFYQKKYAATKTRAGEIELAPDNTYTPKYQANVDVLRFDTSYAFSKSTTLQGGYSMYFNDNYFDFTTTGLPLGLNNFSEDIYCGLKHSFNKDRSVELKYTYSKYDDSTSDHADDYEAHMLYASMNLAF